MAATAFLMFGVTCFADQYFFRYCSGVNEACENGNGELTRCPTAWEIPNNDDKFCHLADPPRVHCCDKEGSFKTPDMQLPFHFKSISAHLSRPKIGGGAVRYFAEAGCPQDTPKEKHKYIDHVQQDHSNDQQKRVVELHLGGVKFNCALYDNHHNLQHDEEQKHSTGGDCNVPEGKESDVAAVSDVRNTWTCTCGGCGKPFSCSGNSPCCYCPSCSCC